MKLIYQSHEPEMLNIFGMTAFKKFEVIWSA